MVSIAGSIRTNSDNKKSGIYLYKYVPVETSKVINKIKTIRKSKKKTTLDKSILVTLGGPFEKIGEKDESIGGAAQKVGSDN